MKQNPTLVKTVQLILHAKKSRLKPQSDSLQTSNESKIAMMVD